VSALQISASQAYSQALNFLNGIKMHKITKQIIFIAFLS
jgi:hypothetical protein